MKRKGADVLLPIATIWVVLLSLFAVPIVGAGQSQGAEQARPAHQQQDTSETKARQKQTFEGKIVRSGGKLVLRDNNNGSTYQLDDQQVAVFFEGKKVTVPFLLTTLTQTESLYMSSWPFNPTAFKYSFIDLSKSFGLATPILLASKTVIKFLNNSSFEAETFILM